MGWLKLAVVVVWLEHWQYIQYNVYWNTSCCCFVAVYVSSICMMCSHICISRASVCKYAYLWASSATLLKYPQITFFHYYTWPLLSWDHKTFSLWSFTGAFWQCVQYTLSEGISPWVVVIFLCCGMPFGFGGGWLWSSSIVIAVGVSSPSGLCPRRFLLGACSLLLLIVPGILTQTFSKPLVHILVPMAPFLWVHIRIPHHLWTESWLELTSNGLHCRLVLLWWHSYSASEIGSILLLFYWNLLTLNVFTPFSISCTILCFDSLNIW